MNKTIGNKRVAIYGAGSLGTILGAYISKKGVSIDLINRNKAHVDALRKNGAQVVGTVSFVQPVVAYTPEEMSGLYDVVFLMTKQQYNAEVVAKLKPFLASDGVLVTFQNGLPELQIAEILGEERVMGCTVAWGATLQSPGVCELTSTPDALSFSLGSMTATKHKYFDVVKSLLELMGEVEVEENFIGTRWSKLLINAAFSGMSAVLGCTFGEAAAAHKSRRVVQGVIKECFDVCKKGEIKIEPIQGKNVVALLDYNNPLKKAFSFMIIPIAIRKHAKLKASMLQDLEKGKLTEVDAINGAVAYYGRKVGVPTPLNDTIVDVIHRIEKGELTPCMDNVKFF